MNIKDFITKLYPICRSITGEGYLESLNIISEVLPLKILEYPTGQKCFDWVIPQEWNVKDAYVANVQGERIVDFQANNLHLAGYSIPFSGRVTNEALKQHLHTREDLQDAIPYVTYYYKRDWGFCVSRKLYECMGNDEYDIVIDTELKDGVLRTGEYYKPGRSKEEIWLSTYLCHPSLCNDNLSGVGVSVAIMKEVAEMKDNYYSYRLLVLPETIGPIVYLANNKELIRNIYGGYVITCVGDRGEMTYKRSIYGDHAIDKMMLRALEKFGKPYDIHKYSPFGSDERQYSSPRFKLAFGSLMRSSHTPKDLSNPFMPDKFPEYHTSLDNLDIIDEDSMQEVKNIYLKCLENLDMNRYYKANYFGEPFLSKHNLYISPSEDIELSLATFYFQGYVDGTRSLWDIQELSGISIDKLKQVADSFEKAGLVELIG